jgi:hypothetical protein
MFQRVCLFFRKIKSPLKTTILVLRNFRKNIIIMPVVRTITIMRFIHRRSGLKVTGTLESSVQRLFTFQSCFVCNECSGFDNFRCAADFDSIYTDYFCRSPDKSHRKSRILPNLTTDTCSDWEHISETFHFYSVLCLAGFLTNLGLWQIGDRR